MKGFTLKKKVAGLTLNVPIYVDEATTDELVRKVTERIKQIEQESERVDTQAYAVLAALAFAAELRAEQDLREQHEADLLRSLRKVTEALRSLARDFYVAS